MGRLVIINRVTVPGPRQVLLHVKIAEINRNATRDVGVSWLYARGNSIFGSVAGNNAAISTSTSAAYNQGTAIAADSSRPAIGTFSGTGTATPGPNSPLFGVFDAGHFSLFIDALRTNSLAKILAEPNLVALDGQPARFLVGGHVSVSRSPELVDSRRNGRGDRPVSALRHDPHVSAARSCPTT